MPRVKITKSSDVQRQYLSLNGRTADLPIDGKFHEIAAELLPALDDADVEYEIENADAGCEAAPAGDEAGLGGSASSLPAEEPEEAETPDEPAEEAPPVEQPDPLDHDGDGKKGGSKKGAASTRAEGAKN